MTSGRGGIVIQERAVAGRGGIPQPVQLGEGDRLNHGITLGGAFLQVVFGFGAVQPVEQFPSSVAEVEKGFPIRGDEETFVLRNLEAGGRGRPRDAGEEKQEEGRGKETSCSPDTRKAAGFTEISWIH